MKGINRVLRFPARLEANRLEQAGRAILDRLHINYLEQEVIGGKFVVDVLIPDLAIIIQWDGDFWHANPKIYPKQLYRIQQTNVNRDRTCTAYLRKCGYTVIRFWESDVHFRPALVQAEISHVLADLAHVPRAAPRWVSSLLLGTLPHSA
jgi:very-short-patch-repair endonuclease